MTDLDRAMGEAAAQYAMPIFFVAAEAGKPLILNNGTAFLLDCGKGPFVVTARHVLQAYRDAKVSRADAVCVVGEIKFDLDAGLIAEDTAHDVATFRVTADDLEALQRGTHPKIPLTGMQRSWPPAEPKPEQEAFFVGFPGWDREMRPYRGRSLLEVDWAGYIARAHADSVSETAITLHLQGARSARPPDWALGGCSGAPLLILDQQQGVAGWRLGGVICQAFHSAGDILVRASRANCINPDGTISAHPDLMAYRATPLADDSV